MEPSIYHQLKRVIFEKKKKNLHYWQNSKKVWETDPAMVHFTLDSIWLWTIITLLFCLKLCHNRYRRNATCNHPLPVLSHQTFHQPLFTLNRHLESRPTSEVPRNGILGTFVLSDQQALGWGHVFHGEGSISDQNIMSAVFRSSSRVLTLSKQMCHLKATQYQYQSTKEPQKQDVQFTHQ